MQIRGWSNFGAIFFGSVFCSLEIIIIVSSLTGEGVDHLRNHLKNLSEEKIWKHDSGTVTNKVFFSQNGSNEFKSPQQICANSVRAALLDTTPSNVAYTIKPKIVDWNEEEEVFLSTFSYYLLKGLYIAVEIDCEKDRVARLIVGKEGQRIAEITDRVRSHMHTLFQRDLVLRINVKCNKKEYNIY